MIAEYDGANAILHRYVHGEGIDDPIVQYDGSGFSAIHFLHADERGSVIALSSASGALENVNRYDEYGVPQGTLTGRFGYTGQLWLPEAGLYHYRARAYNPAMGRFMQTDPIGFSGGMNWYAYVGNNPVNFTDPLGFSEDDCDSDHSGPDCGIVVEGPRSECPDGWVCYSGIDQSGMTISPGLSWLEPGDGGLGFHLASAQRFPGACTAVRDMPGGNDFSAACHVHDACYQSAGMPRDACDLIFLNMMRRACEASRSPSTCRDYATAYYLGVRAAGGPFYTYEQIGGLIRWIFGR